MVPPPVARRSALISLVCLCRCVVCSELRIIPPAKHPRMRLREIRSESIGSLVECRGVVTRVTDVQPMIRVCTYTCDECGNETYQPVDSKDFTPIKDCPSAVCKQRGSKGALSTQTRSSKFVKYQEIRLQEDVSTHYHRRLRPPSPVSRRHRSASLDTHLLCCVCVCVCLVSAGVGGTGRSHSALSYAARFWRADASVHTG